MEPEPVATPEPAAPCRAGAVAEARHPSRWSSRNLEPAPVAEPEAPATRTAIPEPAPVETAEPPRIPTMTAVPVGDPEMQRFASGKAIIRRGDNLWTIARRVYGEGIKYTMIWTANTEQIGDPDMIYPGPDLRSAG